MVKLSGLVCGTGMTLPPDDEVSQGRVPVLLILGSILKALGLHHLGTQTNIEAETYSSQRLPVGQITQPQSAGELVHRMVNSER